MNLFAGTILTRLSCALLACSLAGCLAHHEGAMPGEPAGATFAPIDGARVRYVDSGQGKAPVVLIHGFAASLNTWAGVIPVLEAQGHRVIALDLKGFGWTDRPRGDYSPKAQAGIVLGLLDKLGVDEPVALVAHSWGSSVALATAMRAPERIRRIALYDAWVYAEQLPTFFLWSRSAPLGEVLFALFYKEQPDLKIAGAFYDKTLVSEALVEEVEAQLDRPGTRAAALAAVRGQEYELVQERYATITQPTLLLWGREDDVTPVWVGERLQKQLPDVRMTTYPQCGHFPMIEAYHASTRDLAAFLARDLDAEEVAAPPTQPELTASSGAASEPEAPIDTPAKTAPAEESP